VSRRVFFACFPAPVDLPRLARFQTRTLAACEADADTDAPALRPVPIDGLHVTLAFLGAREAAEIERLVPIGAAVARSAGALTAHLGALLLLPDPQRPRVLACAVASGGALDALAGALASALEAGGFPRDPRPYLPHLTLARLATGSVRPGAPAPVAPLQLATMGLYESCRVGSGTGYRPLWSGPLGGPAG
jgi:2'-5' RNA ligase